MSPKPSKLQGTNPSLAAQLDLVARHLDPTPGNTSQLLDTANIPLSNPLTGPTGPVYSVAFSPDGHTLAAGSGDDTIWLWNVTDPAHATRIGQPLTGPTGAVYSVAFSPDGHTLAAGSGDGTIRLWNVTDPAHAHPLGQPLTGPHQQRLLGGVQPGRAHPGRRRRRRHRSGCGTSPTRPTPPRSGSP